MNEISKSPEMSPAIGFSHPKCASQAFAAYRLCSRQLFIGLNTAGMKWSECVYNDDLVIQLIPKVPDTVEPW
jgi:hypothetical protein